MSINFAREGDAIAMGKKILIAVFIVLIVGMLCFYFGDIIINGTSPSEQLSKMLPSLVICLGGIVKLVLSDKRRIGLAFYEAHYADILEKAFQNSYWNRRKLLCAVRLYNENRYGKAIKYLKALQPRCQYRADDEAVALFLALTYTDMACYEEAARVYSKMIADGMYSTRIYSNLGHVYSKMGCYDDAVANLQLALQNDKRNANAYQNLAALYFELYDFDKAIENAKEALAINPKLRQAASLLAVIYAVKEDGKESQKYAHIAIAAGQDPSDIKAGIERYREGYLLAITENEDE